MPAEEFYQVHTTNLNKPPPVSTITPRKPTPSPPTGRPNPRRSPGPIFLPASIYKLLSDVATKELKKHNATTRSTPPPKMAVNTHDTDPRPEKQPTDTPTGDPTPPPHTHTHTDSPAEPDLDNTELIQFPPEIDKNWVRDGLAKLGQIYELPNWQKIVVLCVHNTTSALNS